METLWSWEWQPFAGTFGIMPMVVNSLVLGTVAAGLGLFWSLGLCLYLYDEHSSQLSSLAHRWVRVSLLGIQSLPPVVLGLCGLFFIVPLVKDMSDSSGYGFLVTVVMLSLLILPTMLSFVENSLQRAQDNYLPRCLALGMTRRQCLLWVCIPNVSKALAVATGLGFARAVSDAMIVSLVSGNSPQVVTGLLVPFRTLSAHMGLVFATDPFSLLFLSFFAAFLALVGMSILPQWLLLRWQERGEGPT